MICIMKTKVFPVLFVIAMTALIFTGCSKVPQAEIDSAKVAIQAADSAGADMYVHDNYVALQDSFNAVMVTIEGQKSKFMKNFSGVKENLAGITQMAGQVQQQAESRKSDLKLEIQNTITEVKALIDTNNQLILQAPRGKEGTTALVAIKGELSAIDSSISEANTMFANGEYMATLDKVKAAKEKATSINTELTGVIAKYKANIKNRKG